MKSVSTTNQGLLQAEQVLSNVTADENRFAKPADLTIGDMVNFAWRGLPILVLGVALGIGLGLLALYYIQPRYTSAVSILIDPKRAGSFGAEEQFASLAVDMGKVANVEQILLSSDFLREIVAAEHLVDDPNFARAQTSRLHSIVEYLQTGRDLPAPQSIEARTDRAVTRLSKMIRISRVGITYVMEVSVAAASAEQAQDLASLIAKTYLADQLSAKYSAARADAGWLQTRLIQLRQDLKSSEDNVETIRQQYGLLETNGSPGSTIDRQMMTDLNAELARAQADVAVTEAKYHQAETVSHSGGDLKSLFDVSGSKAMDDLRARQAEISRHIADLSAVDGKHHPDMLRAKDSLAAVNSQIGAEETNIVNTLRNNYQTASARRDVLQAQLTKLFGNHGNVGSTHGRALLREAERVAEVNRTTYEATLSHLRDVEQQETRQEPEARIISSPTLPERPSFPQPVICVVGGAGLGLAVSLIILTLRIKLSKKMASADLVSRDFDLTVLAMIPELKLDQLFPKGQPGGVGEYLIRDPFSPFAESLRRFRLSLQVKKGAIGHVVQVTSALPGEGKSTLATSLAFSASLAGTNTVLVDLDLRRPSIAEIVSTDSLYGVLDILSGSTVLETTLCRLEGFPLTILSAGEPSSVTDPMESSRLEPLLLDLAKRFDLVVLDTSPVLATSDPLIVAGLADATILVVNWRMPTRTQVAHAIGALRGSGASISGLLLNKAWSRSDLSSRRYQSYYRDSAHVSTT